MCNLLLLQHLLHSIICHCDSVLCFLVDECGTLESVKAATEVYTPVSGKVCEKNTDVESDPALVNKSPYEKGKRFTCCCCCVMSNNFLF